MLQNRGYHLGRTYKTLNTQWFPGRFEPGTGEINFQHLFNELRRLEYDGFVGMEHYSKTNFQTAFASVKRLAGFEEEN